MWLEELFADAYGCVLAGPISVLGFQEQLADGLPADDHGDLGHHPFPPLRPLIQTQILRTIAARKIAGRIVALRKCEPYDPVYYYNEGHELAARIVAESAFTEHELTVRNIVAAVTAKQEQKGEPYTVRDVVCQYFQRGREQPIRALVAELMARYELVENPLTLRRIAEHAIAYCNVEIVGGEIGKREINESQRRARTTREISALILAECTRGRWPRESDLQTASEMYNASTQVGNQAIANETMARVIEGHAQAVWEDATDAFAAHIIAERATVESEWAQDDSTAHERRGNEDREIARWANKIADDAVTKLLQDVQWQYGMDNGAADFMITSKTAVIELLGVTTAARQIATEILTESEKVEGFTTARARAARDIAQRIIAEPEINADTIAAHVLAHGELTVRYIVEQIIAEELPTENTQNVNQTPEPTTTATPRELAEQIVADANRAVPLLQLADLLDAHWHQLLPEVWSTWVQQQWLGTYKPVTEPLRHLSYNIRGVDISGGEILQAVQPVINSILTVLGRLQIADRTWTRPIKADEPSAPLPPTSVTKLYGEYLAFAEEQILNTQLPTLDQIADAFAQHPISDDTMARDGTDMGRPTASPGEAVARTVAPRFTWLIHQFVALEEGTSLDDVAQRMFAGWTFEGPQASHGGGGP